MKDIKPIERRPDGSLPRMTPGQRRRANALIRRECCNYDNGSYVIVSSARYESQGGTLFFTKA
ncbi:cysteine-rich VLP protein [Lacrimispora sp.]|uniref:cysteine-rich VLP protein n=1 Tax=Lacrimispora sp. TaxID=2719234 RepID=UPI00289DD7D5|nr:hypothetical protein [Lacrimispora sp.]